MSKTTLRKRIALVAVSALSAGVLSVVVAPAANANIASQTTIMPAAGELKVATGSNTTGAPIVAASTSAKSLGLLFKDATTSTAQTATVLAGGGLVLIVANAAATSTAFSATGGTFSNPGGVGTTTAEASAAVITKEYGAGNASLMLSGTDATSVAVLWNAPTTAGTYTVSGFRSTNTTNFTTLATRGDGTNIGNITVTVVAAAAAAGPVVANSTCSVATAATTTPSSADTSSAFMNGYSAYINMALKDAYNATNATSGNIVVTATGDAVVNIGTGSSVTAGTANTVVAYGSGTASSYNAIRVSQGTAGVPVTTTVTVSFNGATICTKTITLRGAPASMAIASVSSVESDGAGSSTAYWLADGTNRSAHMYIQLKDSAGNTVLPGSSNDGTNGHTEFSIAAASLSNMVTAFSVASGDQATSVSSSLLPWNYSAAKYTCGSGFNGTQKVTVNHTSAATGKIITGTFDARCAGDAYTYTASFDKASYVQGEIATLTVKFVDSKGNPANSVTAIGTSTIVVPMLTFITTTGIAEARTKADGSVSYTLQVGKSDGLTAGTYNAIVDFTGLTAVAATKQTVTYKVGTGSTDVEFAEVLKSVVALIASINKQIQALQKLILRR
jgi:hypothetical protein